MPENIYVREPAPDGWVYVSVLHRLWVSVPPHERVTEAHLALLQARGGYQGGKAPELVAILREPRCEIAVKWDLGESFSRGKWGPCRWPVYGPGSRCPRHGGPKKAAGQGNAAALAAENEALRAEINALRHQTAMQTAALGGASAARAVNRALSAMVDRDGSQ